VFLIRFCVNLYRSFINIYDDSEFYESGAGLMGENKAYGAEYINKLAGADPVTGKRKISVKKILFRIFILAIVALCLLVIIRMNTDAGFWLNR